MKKLLGLVFKYVVDGKQIVIKRNDKNTITGYSFRSINYDALLQDTEILAELKANEESGELNIRHGKKGSQFVDKDGKVNNIYRDFFYVGYDTRTSYASADDLLAVE